MAWFQRFPDNHRFPGNYPEIPEIFFFIKNLLSYWKKKKIEKNENAYRNLEKVNFKFCKNKLIFLINSFIKGILTNYNVDLFVLLS